MSPPGKNSGFTTKESVLKANRQPFTFTTAWSSRRDRIGFRNAGKKTSRINSALSLPPLPCPSRTMSFANSGTGQVISAMVFSSLGIFNSSACLGMAAVVVIGGAGAFRRDHRSSQRILRRTANGECRAIRWLLQSLQHLRADALGRFIGSNQLQVKNPVGIVSRIFFPQLQTAARNHSDAPPFLVRDFKHFLHDLLCGKIPLVTHRAHVLVPDSGIALLQLLEIGRAHV